MVGRWYTEESAVAHPDRIAAAEAMVAATPLEGYASCCEAIAAMDLTGDLSAIARPRRSAIAGADDPLHRPSTSSGSPPGVKDGSLLVVPRAAHSAAGEQPEAITRGCWTT